MLEMLLASGKGGATSYQDSGPGPTTLQTGTINLGFFGEVTSTEMFTTAELKSLTGYNEGNIYTANPVWLKFAYKGKYLFISKSSLIRSVTWNGLYNNGMVYGTENNGPIESSIASKGVNQITMVNKGAYNFLVRLIKGSDTDPTNLAPTGVLDTNTTRDSEWNKLIYGVSTTAIAASGYVAPAERLASYDNTTLEFNASTYCLIQEHASDNLTFVWGRGATAFNSANRVNVTDPNGMSWRPVLEVIPMGSLYKPLMQSYTITGSNLLQPGNITARAPTSLRPTGNTVATYNGDGVILLKAYDVVAVNNSFTSLSFAKGVGVTTLRSTGGLIYATTGAYALRSQDVTYSTLAMPTSNPRTVGVTTLRPTGTMTWTITA